MVTVVGKNPQEVLRTTCKNCASILEYTWSEVKDVKVNHDYLGDYDVIQAIRCPSRNEVVEARRN
jgi:hypothetical protein